MNIQFDKKAVGEFAVQIVKEAGALLLEMKKQPLGLEEKSDQSDLVTVVDQAVEKFLVGKILEKYPDHGIVGEEGTFEDEGSDFKTQWVIDPIDGTTNFIHNFPFYGISIGVVHEGEGLVGVVYNPMTDELFYAEKDNGAFVNGIRLHLDQPISLREALITTTMFWADTFSRSHLHPSIIEIYKKTRGLRMVGGAAISLCEIAKGTLNAYVAPALSTWDYAGGVIILKEAGGIVTRLNGKEVSFEHGGSLLVAHPSVHQDLLDIFAKYGEFRR